MSGQPIVVGVDGSPESAAAASAGWRIAEAAGVDCRLVHATRDVRTALEMAGTGVSLDALPASAQLRSMEEGYAVQRALIAQWPDRIAGWKVGATSRDSSPGRKWRSLDGVTSLVP